jgi:hypothetical protein
MTVTQPTPPNTNGMQPTIDAYSKTYSDAAAAAQTPYNDSLKALTDAMNSDPSKGALTDSAYTNGGVDTAQTELAQINNQILAEKQDAATKIANLTASPNGAFGTGLQQGIAQIRNQSLLNQANLSVIQMAKQGQYDSAKAIADRAVNVQVEANQNKIKALQATFDANKANFTKAEQDAFTVAQSSRQDAITAQRDQLTKISDLALTALKNGAPAAVAQSIQSATSLNDAEQAAGHYLVTPKTGTEADRTAGAIARYSGAFVPGATLPTGVPVLDTNGKLTPEAFNSALADAPAEGITRDAFIKQFGYLITTGDGKVSPKYNLSPTEQRLVTGSLTSQSGG